ncbi:hypothetical protein ACFWP5_20440 [Streptomyces sp. NPDC058469]|uniref:hypothetical protein n=1 Tax=Streptomyces sp. NPDC058469 TaxID=3346514 RepID=UPI003654A951
MASLVAVAGTLLGSGVTFLFQRRTADRAEAFLWRRLTREERLTAYSSFAEAVLAYRRAQHDPFHRRLEAQDSPALVAAKSEAYHCRLAAQQALLRVEFVTDDPGLVQLAEGALEATRLVAESTDKPSLDNNVERARQALGDFVLHAGKRIRA